MLLFLLLLMLLLLFLPFEIQGKQVSPVAEEKTTPFRNPHLRCTLIKAPTNSSIQILFVLFLKDVEDLKHVCDTFEEPWVILITNELKCATMSKNLIMHDVNHMIRDNKTCNM